MRMRDSGTSAHGAGLSGMNNFDWRWSKTDIINDKDVKVFSTFSCGGGSSLGYKRAGFQVIGNVEIDPKMNDLYITNHHPKYNYCEDLRKFNERQDLPEELYEIDILDGSPPCTSFSMAGVRDRDWGKEKQFREGQAVQTLDDLFFVFLDTEEKLRPKIVIAENVVGMKLDFRNDAIKFGMVRSEHGKPLGENSDMKVLLDMANENDKKLETVLKRITGEGGKFFSAYVIKDGQVAPTITSGGGFYRLCDKTRFSDDDFRNVQSFPQDYDFKKQNVQYVCGMSVPPNMMANIAKEIYCQWLN